jgi:hypothetical protein
VALLKLTMNNDDDNDTLYDCVRKTLLLERLVYVFVRMICIYVCMLCCLLSAKKIILKIFINPKTTTTTTVCPFFRVSLSLFPCYHGNIPKLH